MRGTRWVKGPRHNQRQVAAGRTASVGQEAHRRGVGGELLYASIKPTLWNDKQT